MKPVMQRGQSSGLAAVESAHDPLLRLERIVKSFGDNLVLDGIDLEVASGEVLVVIGPSGSGKSTLLRCINLLEPLDSGRIVFEGAEITGRGTDVSRVRQQIGMVFQQFNLFRSSLSSTTSPCSAKDSQARPQRGGGARADPSWPRSGLGEGEPAIRISSRAASSSGSQLRAH